jgi:uncharacterized RDD family membrane protein YckC
VSKARQQEIIPASGLARLTALGIDMICCLVPILLALMFGWLDNSALETPPGWFRSEWLLKLWLDTPGAITAAPLWFLILLAIWCAGWQIATARTPGAMFMGITLVDRHGVAPTRQRLAARSALMLLIPSSLGLGYLWIWPSRERRAWHDILSGTWMANERATKTR